MGGDGNGKKDTEEIERIPGCSIEEWNERLRADTERKQRAYELNKARETIYFSDVAGSGWRIIKKPILNFLFSRKSPVVALFILSVGILLFPPFVYNGRGYSRVYVGHHFIFNPPSPVVYVDLIRVSVYLLLVLLLCAGWYALTLSCKNLPEKAGKVFMAIKESWFVTKKVLLVLIVSGAVVVAVSAYLEHSEKAACRDSCQEIDNIFEQIACEIECDKE